MKSIAPELANDIVSALRTGAVPPAGLELFATGLERLLPIIESELDLVASGEGRGRAKWIRGEYGSGKTFATRLICATARAKRFATAEVQISINDTPLHHLETVYRRTDREARDRRRRRRRLPRSRRRVALRGRRRGDPPAGDREDDPQFAEAVEAAARGQAGGAVAPESCLRSGPAGLPAARCTRATSRLAQGLLAWLAGQPHIDRSVTSRAGVKGAIDGQAALTFLRGVAPAAAAVGARGARGRARRGRDHPADELRRRARSRSTRFVSSSTCSRTTSCRGSTWS